MNMKLVQAPLNLLETPPPACRVYDCKLRLGFLVLNRIRATVVSNGSTLVRWLARWFSPVLWIPPTVQKWSVGANVSVAGCCLSGHLSRVEPHLHPKTAGRGSSTLRPWVWGKLWQKVDAWLDVLYSNTFPKTPPSTGLCRTSRRSQRNDHWRTTNDKLVFVFLPNQRQGSMSKFFIYAKRKSLTHFQSQNLFSIQSILHDIIQQVSVLVTCLGRKHITWLDWNSAV